MATKCYYGKYRAKVVNVNDPEKRGRIKVMCPKVLGTATSSWCEPCVPVAYDLGGDFSIPKVGEFVWVEFEEGNHNKPIYTGGLWSMNKTPFKNSYKTDTRLVTWGNCKIIMTKDTLSLVAPSVLVNGVEVSSTNDKAILDNIIVKPIPTETGG